MLDVVCNQSAVSLIKNCPNGSLINLLMLYVRTRKDPLAKLSHRFLMPGIRLELPLKKVSLRLLLPQILPFSFFRPAVS